MLADAVCYPIQYNKECNRVPLVVLPGATTKTSPTQLLMRCACAHGQLKVSAMTWQSALVNSLHASQHVISAASVKYNVYIASNLEVPRYTSLPRAAKHTAASSETCFSMQRFQETKIKSYDARDTFLFFTPCKLTAVSVSVTVQEISLLTR